MSEKQFPSQGIKFIPVEKIEPNRFNPNVMDDEAFEALKRDMTFSGPYGIDPILVSPKKTFYNDPKAPEDVYVIIDGEHRWRAAKELGWKDIRCDIRMMPEEIARIVNYRRNRERGNLDPFKEALLFKSDIERGKTQAQIARAYLIDRSTVSRRLSLLKLSDEVLKKVRSVPRGTLTVSHLEPIATLSPENQKQLIEEIIDEIEWAGPPTVKSIEQRVKIIKKEELEQKQLEEAVSKAKFPLCPKCGGEAKAISFRGLPWVRCYEFHIWNLETGELLWADLDEEEVFDQEEAERPKVPKTIRSNYSVEELLQVFTDRFKEFISKLDKVTLLRVKGTLNGVEHGIELSKFGKALNIFFEKGSIDQDNYDNISFRAEPHNYRTGEKTKIEINLWTPTIEDIERLKKFIDSAFQGQLILEEKKEEEA